MEQAAYAVGQKVRHTMEELSGTSPEDLPVAEHIGQVKKKLKGTRKQLENRGPDSK